MSVECFVELPADPSNAVRAVGPWVCQLPAYRQLTRGVRAFDSAIRANAVIAGFGSIQGWKVLELGSLEGADTCQLEQLGADVLAIEANRDSFIRSLVVKNDMNLRARFLLGDFMGYLARSTERWDMIFAAGVLYHMLDPIELLWRIAQHTDRVFIWTLHVNEHAAEIWPPQFVRRYEGHGFQCNYYRYDFPDRFDRHYSGIEKSASRITRATLIGALEHFGLCTIDVANANDRDLMLTAQR